MAKPWHPYEQNLINHPKFLVLSAGAICLWVEGKNYCDMHLTDGMIPRDALRTFRFNSRGRVEELSQQIDGYSGALWELILIDGRDSQIGFRMHDYLNHNPCRDSVLMRIEKADEGRERKKANQKAYRERMRDQPVTDNVTGHASGTEVTSLPDKQKQLQKQKQKQLQEEEQKAGASRSRRPVFSGQRLTVFEWMLDDCVNVLGVHLDAFDLHEWFFALDAMAVERGLVIPKRDGGEWLQAQLVAEARRRGLPLRMATSEPVKTAQDHEAEQRRQGEAALAMLHKSRTA